MAANHSSRLNLALAILFAFVCIFSAQAQSSDEQSLGDVARTKRPKKPAAKVIDEDEMNRRGLVHVPANVRFDCNPYCAFHAKGETYSYPEFRDATEEQRQDAFDAAITYLSQNDWGQRISEIRQEVCRTPGNVDSEELKVLEDEMFTKLRLETRSKQVDETAAFAHPNDASGAEALRQLRIEGMKTSILEVKVDLIKHSCSSLGKAPGH